MAVFQHGEAGRFKTWGLIQVAVNQLQSSLERCGPRALVIYRLELVPEDFLQGLGNAAPRTEHSHAMGLHHAHAVVPVYDKAGQSVPLAVDQAEAVGTRGREAYGSPFRLCTGNAHGPEIRSKRVCGETQHTHRYGAYLVMSAGQVTTFAIVDRHQVAFFRVALDLGYRAGEHPGVIAQERLIPPFFQYQFDHWISSCVCVSFFGNGLLPYASSLPGD